MSHDVERLEAIRRRGARAHALAAPITGYELARLAICDATAAEALLAKLERIIALEARLRVTRPRTLISNAKRYASEAQITPKKSSA